MKVDRWHLISIISILLSVIMIYLWFIIPGFPLLIFLFFPPLFYWGIRGREEPHPPIEHPTHAKPHYCPQCGKQLLEPLEAYCPRCGARTTE